MCRCLCRYPSFPTVLSRYGPRSGRGRQQPALLPCTALYCLLLPFSNNKQQTPTTPSTTTVALNNQPPPTNHQQPEQHQQQLQPQQPKEQKHQRNQPPPPPPQGSTCVCRRAGCVIYLWENPEFCVSLVKKTIQTMFRALSFPWFFVLFVGEVFAEVSQIVDFFGSIARSFSPKREVFAWLTFLK